MVTASVVPILDREVVLPPGPDYALTVRHQFTASSEWWYFLQADAHSDSPEYLSSLHRRHLDLARERNAGIIDAGDSIDVINTRHDARGTKGTIRKEHNRADYLDQVVDDTADRFSPWADNFLYFGRGNHDAKIIKLCETDILRRIVNKLNEHRSPGLPPIWLGGYGGWIKFYFEHKSGGRGQSFLMKVFHGVGGGGEVTKGTMEAQRMAAWVGNADIVVTGHVHESWNMNLVQEYVTERGHILQRPRKHIKLASYKADYRTDGTPTWHMQRPGGIPKPVGGAFLRFYVVDTASKTIGFEVREAPVNYAELG